MQVDTQKVWPDFAKTEFEQALGFFRSAHTLFAQVATVLVIANVTLIGYSLDKKTSSILFIGAIMPLCVIVVLEVIGRLQVSTLFTIISIERKYGDPEVSWLMTTGMLVNLSKKLSKKVNDVFAVVNSEEQAVLLRRLRIPLLGYWNCLVNIVLVFFAIVQIVVSVLLYRYFNWTLF